MDRERNILDGIDLRKKPDDMTQEEWKSLLEKLYCNKPLNEKEWEVFNKLIQELEGETMNIGVHFYAKSFEIKNFRVENKYVKITENHPPFIFGNYKPSEEKHSKKLFRFKRRKNK